ncbi:MAG: hypothetical protein DRO67_09060 [Candidatus Asgardarchaeum californiense]|nr:MAG: hypothetical protein DRO67_09060 [Candidatus Asgardarchaeum californiense]
MKYKLFLKCVRCNRQSGTKEYNVSREKIKQIVKVANMALRLPQYLICPQCHGLTSVKPMLVTIK